MPNRCDLCQQAPSDGSRNHGFDLCEPCASGYVAGRLGEQGIELSVDEVERKTKDATYLELVVKGRVQQTWAIDARFRRKNPTDTVRGWFGAKRFTSGDPLFDSRVVVETKSGATLHAIAQRDGFQSAVMDLLGSCGPWSIERGAIEVRADLEDLDHRADVPLAVACVLWHLQRPT